MHLQVLKSKRGKKTFLLKSIKRDSNFSKVSDWLNNVTYLLYYLNLYKTEF